MYRLAAILALVALLSACGDAERERGRTLFAGEAMLVARIAGHEEVLPNVASRCANCHAAVSAPATAASSMFGPTLSPRVLLEARSRRGGPASRFNATTFCRALRTGIDPASILISRSMPLYELSDRDCAALWVYLSNP